MMNHLKILPLTVLELVPATLILCSAALTSIAPYESWTLMCMAGQFSASWGD